MEKIFRQNNYNKKVYNYYKCEIDNSIKWDQNVHTNYAIQYPDYSPLECGYCGFFFESKNRLFYHLGFMNIDTRPLFDQLTTIPEAIIDISKNIKYDFIRKRIRDEELYYQTKRVK